MPTKKFKVKVSTKLPTSTVEMVVSSQDEMIWSLSIRTTNRDVVYVMMGKVPATETLLASNYQYNIQSPINNNIIPQTNK